MSALYRPVLIETAEQAEALPEGTVAISELFAPEVFTKDGGSWLGTHGPGEFTNLSAVGLTALVPIEAEEETRTVKTSDGRWHYGNGHWTRLVTPWEEVAS